MTTKSNINSQIKVGVFVFGCLVIVLVSLFMIGGDRVFKKHIYLHAEFDQVLGLSEGSVVSLQGIRVGNINKFIFLPEKNKLDVVMKIDASYLPRITEGSDVEIRTQGALGDKYILIKPNNQTTSSVHDGDSLVVAAASDLMGILSEKGGQTALIFDIIQDLKKITKSLADENRTEKMMKNFTEASENMKATSADTRSLVQTLKEQDHKKMSDSLDKLQHILGKIDRGEGTLGALINDSSLHDGLKNMINGSNRPNSIRNLMRQSLQDSK